MRGPAELVSLALLVAGCATVQAPNAPSLQLQVERHIAAIEARNLNEIEATITAGEDLLLILPSGKMSRSRADYMTFHRSLFGNEQWAMTFEPVHLQTTGDYGHALYRVTFDGDGAGPAPPSPAFLSLGFRLENGEWRLVHDQNTAITSAP
jgi:ketosteroid isomerase-like protein